MNGGTIPTAWLNANRAQVLEAIEDGAKEAIIDYVHTRCLHGRFDDIEMGAKAAVANYAEANGVALGGGAQ